MKEGYLPLYRKYRPQKLDDIVGQAHIKRALTNAIEQNKIAHAYLFTGPRGTGKTSTARILAKSLNCINGPTVTPCEECESCKAITNTVPIDVIEIDAASNRSVDDAHEILEKVQYAPVNGKYKIYIIDEVHMLTTHAFNALLKTLEEPPKNVVFILATTESHKVLDTIKSRCQRFDFKRITTADIVEHLKKIAEKEGINITDGAISLIAKSSFGGMRDSLALLDQVSTMGSAKAIDESDINNLLGRLSFESLMKLGGYISASDSASAIAEVEKIYNDGNEPIQILTNLMMFFKNMLIVKTCAMSDAVELTGLNDEQIKSVKTLSDGLEKHQIVFLINKSADYIKELKTTTNQQMWLEIGLIDLSNLAENTKLHELEARILRLEGGSVDMISAVSQKNIVHPPKISPAEVINKIDTTVTTRHSVGAGVEDASQLIPANVTEESQTGEILRSAQDDKIVAQDDNVRHSEDEVRRIPQDVSLSCENINLAELWNKILQVLMKGNLSGLAKMKAMTSLVKYDEEGIVVAGKTPTFTANLNAPSKRSVLVNVIYSVIGRDDIPVIIRQRTAEDGKAEKVKLPQPQKPSIVPKDLADVPDEDEVQSEPEVKAVLSQTASQSHSEDGLSEQASMVKDLFDGKVID